MVAEALKVQGRSAWLDVFAAADVPAAPINAVAEAIDSPQTRARSMVQRVKVGDGEAVIAGNPIKVGDDETTFDLAPRRGADGETLLRERLGYDAARIDALRAAGALG